MRIIDLSQPLYDGCPNCPAHPAVKIELIQSHARSGAEGWHVEHLSFASHTGSHVDAPLHKIQGGRSLSEVPLESFAGPAHIVDLRGIAPRAEITREQLAAKLPATIRQHYVLLATGWGEKRTHSQDWLRDAPTLSPSAAQWLASKNARGVGIDHYSIGGAETHQLLLAKPVFIVEELRFPEEAFALPQPVDFWALPINLRDHSGAPCRPVIIIQ